MNVTQVENPIDSVVPTTDLSRRAAMWWVVGLSVLGAVLRFWKLDSPGIWGDEAATYGRVNGSYWDLMEVLQFDGFMPLHYQIYYLMARVWVLDPWLMRLWPAICGTLTVPAMYFLARQLGTRRMAVWATLLAATSAYLLYYARDAKMYAPMWVCVTVSMGCFLYWLNEGSGFRSRMGFWGWVFATTAAGGIHAPGLLVLAIQPLMYFAHPNGGGWMGGGGKRWLGLRGWKLWAMLVGMVVIAAGPVAHFRFFSKWDERIAELGWNASMLQWVKWYNEGRELPELLRYTGTAFASAWEWPDKKVTALGVNAQVLGGLQWWAIGVGVAVLLGVLPWGRMWGWVVAGWRRVRKVEGEKLVVGRDGSARGGWFVAFVLAAWVVLPVYGVYVISYKAPAGPWEVVGFVWEGGLWWMLGAAVVVLGVGMSMRSWWDLLRVVGGVAVLIGICSVVWWAIPFDRTHSVAVVEAWPFVSVVEREVTKPVKMLWMPRYLGVVFPAVLIGATMLMLRLPVGVRQVAIAGVVVVNLANFGAKVWIDPEPPVRRIMGEMVRDSRADDATAGELVFVQAAFGAGFEPGSGTLTGVVGRYHYSTMTDPPVAPVEFRGMMPVVERGIRMRTNLRQNAVRGELAKRPGATKVVLWERGDGRATEGRNPMGRVLGPEWAMTGVETFDTYDHWTWQRLAQIRRYEYVKVASTQPATRGAK